MKKFILLLFTMLSCKQQQYDTNIIRNLEEINSNTDISIFFKGVPMNIDGDDYVSYDERFLRYYDVPVDYFEFKIKHSYGSDKRSKIITIIPFNKEEDYKSIKSKLTRLYGNPIPKEKMDEWSFSKDNDVFDVDSIRIELKKEGEGEDLIFNEISIQIKKK